MTTSTAIKTTNEISTFSPMERFFSLYPLGEVVAVGDREEDTDISGRWKACNCCFDFASRNPLSMLTQVFTNKPASKQIYTKSFYN
jgi:hypothetical protein